MGKEEEEKISKVTAIVNTAKGEFLEQYRTLILDGDDDFTIGIKEFEEQKTITNKRIAFLESDRKARASKLESENNRLFKEHKVKFATGEEFQVTREMYDKEMHSHSYVSYRTNYKPIRDRYELIDKKIVKEITKLEKRLTTLNTNYKDVRWNWSLVYSGYKEGDEDEKGSEVVLSLSKHIHGGGCAWVEPYIKGKGITGNKDSGIFVQVKSLDPQFITAEWYYEGATKPIPVGTKVPPGTRVELQVYTNNLYGCNFRVELKNNEKSLKAHGYHLSPTGNDSDEDGVIEVNEEITKDFFYAEVKLYDYKDSSELPNGVCTGYLEQEKKSIPHVQKAVIPIVIEPLWYGFDEKGAKIKPTIHYKGNTFFLKSELLIDCQKIPKIKHHEMGNTPVFVDEIETNCEVFHHCGYTKFVIEAGDRSIDILKDNVYPINRFELVAGSIKNIHKVTINIDAKTGECTDEKKKHKGRVITIDQCPENIQKKNTKPYASINVLNTGNEEIETYEGVFQKIEHNDNILKFYARYIYDKNRVNFLGSFGTVIGTLHPIYRYLWLGNDVPTNEYIINTSTCGYNYPIKIVTYPDVTWSLKFTLTSLEKSKELLSNEGYKKGKFRRKKQDWITVGERELGISLGASWDKDQEFDLDLKEKYEDLTNRLETVTTFVKDVFEGKKNRTKNNNSSERAKKKEEAIKKREEFLKSPKGVKKIQKKEKKLAKEITKRDKKRKKDLKKYKKTVKKDGKKAKKIQVEIDKIDKRNKEKKDSKKKNGGLKGDLVRSALDFSIQWPQVEAEFNWSRENITQLGQYYNQTGVVLEGALKLDPLIGLSIELDFLALVQRAHPIAMAVIAIIDVAADQLGGEITCSLTAKGQFGGIINGFLNTKTKQNTFNQVDSGASGKEIASVNCSLEFEVEISIKLEGEKKVFFIGVDYKLEGELTATAKWTGNAPLDHDDDGWFIKPSLEFDGLIARAEYTVEAKTTINDTQIFDIDEQGETDDWVLISPSKEPMSFDNMYFMKK